MPATQQAAQALPLSPPITVTSMTPSASIPDLRPIFTDNVCVCNGRESREFLSISRAPSEQDQPYEVSLRRYYLPGRCDAYRFDWMRSPRAGIAPRLRYFADSYAPLPTILKLVARDMDRPQVVKMVVNAFSASRILSAYSCDFHHLLRAIAPKSISYREFCKLEGAFHRKRLRDWEAYLESRDTTTTIAQ